MTLSQILTALRPVLAAPWDEQLPRFRRLFAGEAFELSHDEGATIVTICAREIAPLRDHLRATHGPGEISVSPMLLNRLCTEQDPRNGAV